MGENIVATLVNNLIHKIFSVFERSLILYNMKFSSFLYHIFNRATFQKTLHEYIYTYCLLNKR